MKIKRLLWLLIVITAVIVFLLWTAGTFAPKIPMTVAHPTATTREYRTVAVTLVKIPRLEAASGTVQAVHETTISSKLAARVIAVKVKAGQTVGNNELLIQLDDADLRAKLQQAESNVKFADASHAQAVIDERRLGSLLKNHVVSQQEYDNALTKLKTSDAELKRSKEAVKEVQSTLAYTAIAAPFEGLVTDKKVDVGDTVVPGQTLLKLYDQKHMQLVAEVRESLTRKLTVGQSIAVKIDALAHPCSGTVSEIVPESNSASRTFQVKVTGPCPPGIYTGMFGRILIPLEDEPVLVVPPGAVKNVGQLELVEALENGQPVRRAVRTGRTFDNSVEILSGLREGEQVVITQEESAHDR